MDQKMMDKWLTALRSGKYEQGQDYLCREDGDNSEDARYCCLGVLADLAEVPYTTHASDGVRHYIFPVDPEEESDYGDVEWMDSGTPPARWLGLPQSQIDTLARMNDKGETFETIADYIEQNL